MLFAQWVNISVIAEAKLLERRDNDSKTRTASYGPSLRNWDEVGRNDNVMSIQMDAILDEPPFLTYLAIIKRNEVAAWTVHWAQHLALHPLDSIPMVFTWMKFLNCSLTIPSCQSLEPFQL